MSTPASPSRGITVRFGGLTAVNRFSMKVQPGAIHALIGPNGAGKSTVFNCISRIYQPAEGRMSLDGEDITGLQPHVMAASASPVPSKTWSCSTSSPCSRT